MLNVLEDILSAGLTKAASIQASLPISMGGLGLVPNALIANAAFWGSWSTSASLLSSHFTVSSTPPSTQPLDPLAPSRDFPLLKPFLTSVVEDSTFPLHRHLALSRSSLPQSYLAEAPTFNSVAISPALKEQHKASVALLSQRRRTLSQDLPLPCRARLLSSSGRASGAWLHAQPMGGQLAMFQAIHLTAVRLRLGLPHPGKRADAKCACGRIIGPETFHPLLCPLFPSSRHAQALVIQEISSMANLAGFTTTHGFSGLLQGKSVPLAIAKAGLVTGIQVDFCDPTSSTHNQGGTGRKGASAYKLERDHLRSITLIRSQDRHVPIVFESYGLMGGQVDGLLKEFAADIVARSPGNHTSKSQVLQFLRYRLSVVVISAISRAIITKPDASFSSQPPLPPFPSLLDPNCEVDLSDLPREDVV